VYRWPVRWVQHWHRTVIMLRRHSRMTVSCLENLGVFPHLSGGNIGGTITQGRGHDIWQFTMVNMHDMPQAQCYNPAKKLVESVVPRFAVAGP
jgi:hypothetical protein